MEANSSKRDYLKKYTGTARNTKASLVSNKFKQKEQRGAVTVVNQDIDFMANTEKGMSKLNEKEIDEDDDLQVIVEDPEGLVKGENAKRNFSKSTWVTLEEGKEEKDDKKEKKEKKAKKEKKEKEEMPKRRRHDSDSEDEFKPEVVQMLPTSGVTTGEFQTLKIDASKFLNGLILL